MQVLVYWHSGDQVSHSAKGDGFVKDIRTGSLRPLEMGLYLMKLGFNQMNRVLCQLFACNITLIFWVIFIQRIQQDDGGEWVGGWATLALRFLTRQTACRCSGVFFCQPR